MDAPVPPAARETPFAGGPAAPLAGGWTEPGADVPWSPVVRRALPSHRLPRERSAAWAGLLGWLVPGLGQVFLGRWGAGLVLLLVIGSTFAGGLALTDFTCVDPRTYQLEFVAHLLIAGPTFLTLGLTDGVNLERMPPWIEVGRLYVVVAGFLNLVALCDALGECWRRNARIQALAARLAVRGAAPAWDDAAFLALADIAKPRERPPDVPAPPPEAPPPVGTPPVAAPPELRPPEVLPSDPPPADPA